MKDLGLRRDGEGIDFRERAPLVVPPSRNLPPPQDGTPVTANPAWPKDPDAASARRRRRRRSSPAGPPPKPWRRKGGRCPARNSIRARPPARSADRHRLKRVDGP